MHRAGKRSRSVIEVAGLVAGALAGATTVVVGPAVAQQNTSLARTYVEATHLPPLLTTSTDDVLLGFDAYCIDPAVDVGEPSCGVTGSIFVRVGAAGRFDELPLGRDVGSGRLAARIPNAIASARAGFTYYAELEATEGGGSLTLPAGGASAPQRSLPLGEATEIDLGAHRFGEAARSDERLATAAWGNGPSEAGLEQGRSSTPIGASAFDVDASGAIVLLDQVHRRLLRWRNGARAPERIAVDVDGTLADMALAPDGTVYVLETVSRPGSVPLVRRFDSSGRELGSTEVAERTPSQIRNGPGGPVVLQQPSQQWMPVTADGSLASPGDQRRRGSSGRPIGSGTEVIVLRTANEIRVALAGPAGVRRAWRITSETALAEVQLADAYGDRLVVVVRVFSDHDDEFLALVLGRTGLIRRLSVDPADWAETAPLGRFRLVGKSLYRLGSTLDATFVDRFDLEAG